MSNEDDDHSILNDAYDGEQGNQGYKFLWIDGFYYESLFDYCSYKSIVKVHLISGKLHK